MMETVPEIRKRKGQKTAEKVKASHFVRTIFPKANKFSPTCYSNGIIF